MAESPSISIKDNEPAAAEEQVIQERLRLLRGYYLDIADIGSANQEETDQYILHGGSLRLCLNEIEVLEGDDEAATPLDGQRAAYMETLFANSHVFDRNDVRDRRHQAEKSYVDSVVNKIQTLITASTPQEALELRQMPTLIRKASFVDGQELSMEDFASNHLYLLVDTALKEHVKRRQIVDRHKQGSVVGRVIASRALRVSVAGAVFVASVLPETGLLTTDGSEVRDRVELGLQILSGAILGLDTPELVRLQLLDFVHHRKTERLNSDLASTKSSSDLALRMAYGSTRYGGTHKFNVSTGRDGTDDPGINRLRFAHLNDDFVHLNNDPGGKPYSGQQVLGYAGRLLIERPDELKAIIDSNAPAAQRQALFLDLTKEIITEDVVRMKKGLTESRFRRTLMKGMGIVPAVLFPGATSAVSDASTLGRDTSRLLPSKTDLK